MLVYQRVFSMEINPSSYHLGPYDDNADIAFQVNTVTFQVQTVTQAGGRHLTGIMIPVPGPVAPPNGMVPYSLT